MGSPNQGGTADLNLSGEFGKYRLTLQGVKVQKTLAERFGSATRKPVPRL